MLHQYRVKLFAAGFVIHHQGQRGVTAWLVPQIHTVNPPPQREPVASAQIQFQRGHGRAVTAEIQFRRRRVKFILVSQPRDDDLDEILQ